MMQFLARRTARVTAALGAAAIVVSGASVASATTVLAGGSVLTSGSTVSGPLSGSATLKMGSTVIVTCTGGSLSGMIGTNPSSPSVAVTPAGFRLGNAVAGGSCIDALPSIKVTGASLATAGTGSVTTNAGLTGGSLDVVDPTFRVTFIAGGLPGTCMIKISSLSLTALGLMLNSNSSLTYSDVPVTTSATSGVCTVLNGSLFSAIFKPLTSGGLTIALG